MSRAMTYNNPGNVSLPIKGYHGPGTIIGAPGQKDYASFPDLASGFAAFDQQVTTGSIKATIRLAVSIPFMLRTQIGRMAFANFRNRRGHAS